MEILKECECCGIEFVAHSKNVKYCPECRVDSSRKMKALDRNIKDSIRRCGTGQPQMEQKCKCEQCSKIFIRYIYKQDSKFCSQKCRSQFNIEHTFCGVCGKPMTETEDIRDVNNGKWFCSDECRKTHDWKVAREKNKVHICLNCGTEFINKDSKYCSRQCYLEYTQKVKKRNAERKAAGITECPVCHKDFLIKDGYAGCCSKECSDARKKSEPHADRKCRMCGTTFSCAVSEMTIPLCSDICRTKYHKIIRRNKTDLSAHKAVQKEKKTKEKKIKYIKENGLCSICKTSYRDCERMQSNYTASPEGSVFDGNLVIKCPKYKN